MLRMEAVLLADNRVAGRFMVLPTESGRQSYVHLDDDEDVSVVHGTEDVEPFAYRYPSGSAEVDFRPVTLELYEGIGKVYVVDLPGDRTLLVPT